MNDDNLSHKGRVAPGLPDELFERGAVPLTKSEIRCLTLARLDLREGQTVLDVGAGSGGLTVECSLLLKQGRVYAVEREAEAVALIRANCKRFGLNNVTLLEGEAPEILKGVAYADRIIVGGSGGKLSSILEKAYTLLPEGGKVVINCLLLETLAGSLRLLAASGFIESSYIQAAISRSQELGGGTYLKPINPVYIVSARKG